MSYRLSEKNKIVSQLTSLETKIDRAKKSNDELIRSTMIRDREYKEIQMKNNDDLIAKYTEEYENVKDRLHRLERGELDDEIQEEIDKNMKAIHKKHEISRKKEEELAKKDMNNKKESEKFNEKTRSSDYQSRQLKFEMQKAYERFCETDIPDYITDNLRTMPNNKGYIWKNIWCFGEKPAAYEKSGKPEQVVMFERQRDTMFIHEITDNEHYLYKKVGQQPREYVSGFTRNSKLKPKSYF